MSDEFILSVLYKGEDRDFTAKLLVQGYTHKFQVTLPGTDVFFEPDEEGQYRMIKMPGQEEKDLLKIDRELLALLQRKIEEVLH